MVLKVGTHLDMMTMMMMLPMHVDIKMRFDGRWLK